MFMVFNGDEDDEFGDAARLDHSGDSNIPVRLG